MANMENITPAKRALAVLDAPPPAEPVPELLIRTSSGHWSALIAIEWLHL